MIKNIPSISPDFQEELKAYYNNPLGKNRYYLPDLFSEQRISSNKWKSKLLSYLLRFESNSWKLTQKQNPYNSRSVTPPLYFKNDSRKIAKELNSHQKLSENDHSFNIIVNQSKSKSEILNKSIEDNKYQHKPFLRKQRKYKLYDPAKISETSRNKSLISNHYDDRSKSTERSVNIIKACEDYLEKSKDEKEKIHKFLEKYEKETKSISYKQKNYDESLFKEFVDMNSVDAQKEEKENLIQRKESEEKLVNWMRGENRMNKLKFMKYDTEINGIKSYKRRHNLKKIAIDIRKLN